MHISVRYLKYKEAGGCHKQPVASGHRSCRLHRQQSGSCWDEPYQESWNRRTDATRHAGSPVLVHNRENRMIESAELGAMQRVDLGTVWHHELDFSGWLARHIDLLDEQVNWDLDTDSVRQEVTKGALRVDLLLDATAPDTGDRFPVVIENQLGTTDGSHLAGVMAYMVAFEAQGMVWIAGDVRHEYVAVMEWLNDNTNIDAYLFKIEAVTIDNSQPAPLLTRIVGPSAFSHGGRQPANLKLKQKVRDWWAVVLPELQRVHDAWKPRRPTAHSFPSVPIPGAPAALRWYVNVGPHGSSLGIKILGATLEESNYYFDQLIDRLDSIQKEFGEEPLSCSRGPGRVRWLTSHRPEPGGRDDEPDVQKKAAVSLAAAMKRLVAATEHVARSIPPYPAHTGTRDKTDQAE